MLSTKELQAGRSHKPPLASAFLRYRFCHPATSTAVPWRLQCPSLSCAFDPGSYATVADRITLFYERFPSGRIQTELVSRVNGEITFKALVFRNSGDVVAAASGWASEREDDGEINAVACLENTETSAIGRALANLGFTSSTKRPSREEMQKAERARRRMAAAPLSVHREADAVHDLLELLGTAERRGFSSVRADVIRRRTNQLPAVAVDRVRGIETLLRSWLRRRIL